VSGKKFFLLGRREGDRTLTKREVKKNSALAKDSRKAKRRVVERSSYSVNVNKVFGAGKRTDRVPD